MLVSILRKKKTQVEKDLSYSQKLHHDSHRRLFGKTLDCKFHGMPYLIGFPCMLYRVFLDDPNRQREQGVQELCLLIRLCGIAVA